MSRMNLRAGLLCFTSLARVLHARSTGMLAAVVLVVGGLTGAPVFAAPQAATPATARNADDVPEGLSSSDWSSIRAAYEAGRHAVVADQNIPGHYRARNPGQQWLTHFDGRGFLTTPDAGGWVWGLDLVSYGRGDIQRTIGGSACIQTKGTRVEYEWNHALTEWYINDQRGFEHGYTLRERPEGANGPNGSGDGMLHFTLAVRGDLHPRVSESGRNVAFITASGGGATALTYNNLKVFDADGVHLAASFQATTTAAGTPALRLTIDDTGARYPLTIDPTAQQAYLKAADAVAVDPGDQFGVSVSVSGDTVVVGAPQEDSSATGVNGDQADNGATDSGAAYVFVRSGSTWTQQAYLKASNTGAGDVFGYSVAVSGDTVMVGAYGESSSATGINGNQANNNTPVSGAAYVFVRSGTTWTQQAYLKASNSEWGDRFGSSVAVSGDTVVVGAWSEDSNATGVNGNQADNSATDSGAAYVFVRTSTTWTQQAYLKASNPGLIDFFGYSVAVSGDTIVVGAWSEDSNATGVNGNQANNSTTNSGAAYVFVRTGTTWTQQAYLKASNPGLIDQFGFSVSVSGDTVVVAAPYEDSNATGINGNQADNSATDSGAAYVFVRSGTNWTQQAYLKASNTGADDFFGYSVAVSGDTVMVGAYGEDSNAAGVSGNQADNSSNNSGAAYVFVRSGTTWTQQTYLKASNTGAGNAFNTFGFSVAVSGDTVVVGAYQEDSSATGVNGNQADNSANNSGAAYVFVRSGTTWTQQAYLKASNTGGGDFFGHSVAVSGDTVVVGAPQEDSSATGVNGNQADNSGFNCGAAYVFVRSGTTWTQQAYLKASNTGESDWFAYSVAVSGDTIVVGAWSEDSNATGVNGNQADNTASASGAACVFVRTGTTWTQQAYLKAANTGAEDRFGYSVAVSGDTVVVGAYQEDSNATGVNGNQADNSATDSGAAYVFVRSGTTWTQHAYLKASNTEVGDAFGLSVAVSGDTVVVGAGGEGSNARGVNGNQANNSVPGAGAAYVFVRSGTTWTQQAYLKASNPALFDGFGFSVSVSGDTVVVAAPYEDSNATGINGNQADNSATNSGAAYVFVRTRTTWTQQAYLKASNTGADDFFGYSVAVSGDTIVVGAWSEDSNATGVSGNQADNSAKNSGAAYVFLLPLPTPASPLATPATVCSADPAALSVSDPGAGIVIDWFAGSCGGTLIGTGNPFNVTPSATTTYYARARRTADGNTSDACASVVVAVNQCCPADLNGDTFVDNADFVVFAAAYNIVDCADPTMPAGCPADLNADGFVDDADFVLFAKAYEELLCP